jgi:hypothetical protein
MRKHWIDVSQLQVTMLNQLLLCGSLMAICLLAEV